MEAKYNQKSHDYFFLSRLYGVEGFLMIAIIFSIFLSRLYGVEVIKYVWRERHKFLSRLYGVEGDYLCMYL